MRVAVGRWWQESNDLSDVSTTLEMFAGGTYRGDELFREFRGTRRAEVGGFVDALDEWKAEGMNIEIIPLISSECFSAGRMVTSCHNSIQSELLSALRNSGPVDAVLLSLHGAMVSELHPDVEGHTLSAVRELVGEGVVIIATLDLHCNITEMMVRSSNTLVLYHTTPHIDMYETGLRGVTALRKLVGQPKKAPSVTAFAKLPLILPIERASTQASEEQIQAGTLSSVPPLLLKRLKSLEEHPWCVAAGVSTTQPWLNIGEFGSAVVVSGRADDGVSLEDVESKCKQATVEIAQAIVDGRDDYMPNASNLVDYKEAVVNAHEYVSQKDELVVIGDGSDATTSGAPGDSTWLISEIIKYTWPRQGACIPMISDSAVRSAMLAGEGGTLPNEFKIGKTRRNGSSRELVVPVGSVVEKVFRAKFHICSGHCAGLSYDLGDAATILLSPSSSNVRIIVTQYSGPHFAMELFKLGGVVPTLASCIVAKSPAGFRATYGDVAGLIISSDSPGSAPSNFWLPEHISMYSKINRPLWPWDELPDDYRPNILLLRK